MRQIKTAISSIFVGKTVSYSGLTAFPLKSKRQSALSYLLLENGLRDGLVSIREASAGGSVPELSVKNRADRPVLVVDGEELVGAKQNRVANLSMLLPAGQTTIIPVSCVERGRWAYNSPDFALTNRVHFAKGRAEKLRSVLGSMRHARTKRSDQLEIWRSIDAKARMMAAESPTGAMGAIFERHGENLDNYVQAMSPGDDQLGALFVMGSQFLGLDMFDKPATFAKFLPKLVRSYAIDVIERGADKPDAPAPSFGAIAFLDRLRNAPFDDYPSVGLGRDAGALTDGLIAGALVVDDDALHLAAFPDPRHGSIFSRKPPGYTETSAVMGHRLPNQGGNQ